jgi:MFS family permease
MQTMVGLTAGASPYASNVVRYALIEMANASTFAAGNWLFFWLRVMNYGQVGVVDALAFAFGMLMEIPTGAIGDLVGKKATLTFAMTFNALGWLIMGLSDSLEVLLGGFLVAQIGWAFYSGASEAFAYDSLQADGREGDFDRVYSRVGVLATITVIVTSLIGGIMYNVDERLPHLAWALAFALGAVATLGMKEPPTGAESVPFSWRSYVAQLSAGFRYFRAPSLRGILVPIMASRGGLYMFQSGLILPVMAIQFGFFADEQAVLMAVLLVGAVVGTWLAPSIRTRYGNRNSLLLAAGLVMLGYLAVTLPLGALGVVTMVGIRLGGGVLNVVSSVLLNEAIPSQDRATTLSTVAMFVRVPYVVAATAAGATAEAGAFALFCVVVAGLMGVSLLPLARYQEPS